MSLRIQLYGFQFDILQGLIGSGDGPAFARIESQMRASGDSLSDRLRDETLAVVRRALDEGCPFPELDAERDAHVMAAHALAQHGQELLDLQTADWKMAVLWETYRLCSELLTDAARNGLHHLCYGRPLFGRRIESSWSLYAYLTRAEADCLREALLASIENESIATAAAELDGFVYELADWLEATVEGGRDLWLWAE